MKILLMLILFPAVVAASSLVTVRVFYDADGKFLAKYIRSNRTAKIVVPKWAIGSCDIAAVNFVKSDVPKERARIDPSDCSFYQAARTIAEQAEKDRNDRIAALKVKIKEPGGLIDSERDELLLKLLEIFGR